MVVRFTKSFIGFFFLLCYAVAFGQSPIWLSANFHGSGDSTRAMVSDAVQTSQGEVVVVGTYRNAAFTNVSQGRRFALDTLFIAKYDRQSRLIWERRAISYSQFDSASAVPRQVLVDHEGSIYVSAEYDDTIIFDGGKQLTNAFPKEYYDPEACCIAKFSSGGELLWAKTVASDGVLFRMALDSASALICAGTAFPEIFGISVLDSLLHPNSFLCKLDGSNGNIIFLKILDHILLDPPVSEFFRVASVAVDRSGNIALTGSFSGRFGIAEYFVQSAPNATDAFIASYSPLGDFRWIRSISSLSSTGGRDITIDQRGDIYITANSGDSARFSHTDTVSKGIGFVAIKYSSTGVLQWFRRADFGGQGIRLAYNHKDDELIVDVAAGGWMYVDSLLFKMGTGASSLYYRCTSDGKFLGANPVVVDEAAMRGNSLTVGLDGSVFVTGELQRSKDLDVDHGALFFDSLTLTTNLLTRGFFARFGNATLSVNSPEIAKDFSALHLSSNPVFAEAFRISYKCNESGMLTSSLCDPLGRLLDTQHTIQGTDRGVFTFDVSHLPTGTYFIYMQTQRNVVSIPVVIIH
jgi:hypothetical protein